MPDSDLLKLTTDIVTSHLSNNNVSTGDVPGLIRSTYEALSSLGVPETKEPDKLQYTPAVTAKKSLADRDKIISMIDGKAYSSLKRHLGTHGLTPAEYRERYGLKADYPMIAPGYSERRREVARTLGLGRKPKAEAVAPAPADGPKRGRGRPKLKLDLGDKQQGQDAPGPQEAGQ